MYILLILCLAFVLNNGKSQENYSYQVPALSTISLPVTRKYIKSIIIILKNIKNDFMILLCGSANLGCRAQEKRRAASRRPRSCKTDKRVDLPGNDSISLGQVCRV